MIIAHLTLAFSKSHATNLVEIVNLTCIPGTFFFTLENEWTGEVSQLGKYLAWHNKNLRSDDKHPLKNVEEHSPVITVFQSRGRRTPEAHWPASFAQLGSELQVQGETVFNNNRKKVWGLRKTHRFDPWHPHVWVHAMYSLTHTCTQRKKRKGKANVWQSD